MKVSNHTSVPVYTVAGSSTARPLPDWLIRKRKRSLKNDAEFANRVELLQGFEFEEASNCVRVSEDGDWAMSTGTYKPQIHAHYLPHLATSFEHHTNSLNETFLLLASDYSKSLHLQTDRSLEFHTQSGLHYRTRIPRYGRDLLFDRHSCDALVPAVGQNSEGSGEVFRLNLEVGRFMRSYEVDIGDSSEKLGFQGGVDAGSVNTGSIAEASHNLLAFGTSLGTVEFWDSRSRNRVGILTAPQDAIEGRSEVTALQFHRSGLELAAGTSSGLVYLYDLRSPTPLLKKDQGYGFPIQNLIYLNSGTNSETKILSADKRIIKIWEPNGTPWTSVEPEVDLRHVEWIKDSGMLMTANEGRAQHIFFIPQLGPAPKWCSFLDNLVEEMAEDPDDPNAFENGSAGEIYSNYKFLSLAQLRQLSLDHLIGKSSLLRPYMHGYFVQQKLYEEARLISNPDLWQEQRKKSIQEKIDKERESRIRGSKKVAAVKVNRKLAERILEREEKNERRRARRVLEKGGDDDVVVDAEADTAAAPAVRDVEDNLEEEEKPKAKAGILNDPRFARLFEDEDFQVDETSHEFQAINPSTKLPKGLTAVEQEELESRKGSSDDDDDDEVSSDSASEARTSKPNHPSTDNNRLSTSSYKKSGHKPQRGPQMLVSSSGKRPPQRGRDKTFGSRVSKLKDTKRTETRGSTTVVGEKEIRFAPAKKSRKPVVEASAQRQGRDRKDRRSASGNVFRRM